MHLNHQAYDKKIIKLQSSFLIKFKTTASASAAEAA
jgi:hypothetical protein